MIAYLDSSALVRAYLADEPDHASIVRLLGADEIAVVTGSWTRIEVSGALVRAARVHRGDETVLLAILDADLSSAGAITVVHADQDAVEDRALQLVRTYAIRAMDAWHLAVAEIVLPALAEAGEEQHFISRDVQQADVARSLGFLVT